MFTNICKKRYRTADIELEILFNCY